MISRDESTFNVSNKITAEYRDPPQPTKPNQHQKNLEFVYDRTGRFINGITSNLNETLMLILELIYF